MLFRPSPTPSTSVPLGARSVGCYRVQPGWREDVSTKHFTQIFWSVRGRGAMVMNGVEHPLKAGDIGLYPPGMEHRVYALDEPWEVRWWTMDGALVPAIIRSFGLARAGVFSAGPAPVELFQELHRAIRTVTPEGERQASALAYRLLALAAGGKQRAGPRANETVEAAARILRAEWNNPTLGIKPLAARLGLHRSSLTRQFRAAMGLAPVAYLSSLRMQNALSLLTSTDLPVAVIARRTGFTDPYYFSRCVTRATGLSPRAFRRKFV
jgi:AraC-like DNA-binding protein